MSKFSRGLASSCAKDLVKSVRTDRAACIVLSVVWGLALFSPARAGGQAATTAFEMRLAETMPATGLVEAQVSGSSDKVYLHREAIVTNADVVRATVVPGITSVNFNVAVTFNSAGAAKMAKATAAHLNKPVAILINGRVVAAPIVRAQVGDQAVISGDFDRDQASAIAAGLNRR
jgi:preprotein translocase subunit SecD